MAGTHRAGGLLPGIMLGASYLQGGGSCVVPSLALSSPHSRAGETKSLRLTCLHPPVTPPPTLSLARSQVLSP